MTTTHCGYVAMIGRPNVGKSTLINALMKKKLVITSKKPQTTRHAILGIKSTDHMQVIYVDTPGFRQISQQALHLHLNRTAQTTMHDVDVLVMVVHANRWTADDDAVLELLKAMKKPVILAINKIDLLASKNDLLPLLEKYQTKYPFVAMVPISAMKENNLEELERVVESQLPESPFYYDKDQLTDRDDVFMVSELIREKVMRLLGKEVPYSVAVEIERMQDENGVRHIDAILWVERDGQKGILIGEKGGGLKKIGTLARKDIEAYLKQKVFLQCWVKVKEDWTERETQIKRFGYR